MVSNATLSLHSTDANSKWCSVAYWEKNERVGPFVSFHTPSISIHARRTQSTSDSCLSLHTIHRSKPDVASSISVVRQHIGSGVTIFRDGQHNVWLYNASKYSSVFVYSPSINESSKPGTSVKLCPGQMIKVYDYEVVQKIKNQWELRASLDPHYHAAQPMGPMGFHSFKVSFSKGFGGDYSRATYLQCPCWMEVMLHPVGK